jgi:hypothetical protein
MPFGRSPILSAARCLAALALVVALAARAGEVRFNRDIRPILSENCFTCHGHDKNQRKADLRLDVREIAVKQEAVVPGKPAESKLVLRIFAEDADDVMPPPKTHKVLTAPQKELLKRWIAEGAEYEPHWAYIHPVRTVPPQPRDRTWARNPIDAFILAGLDAKDLQPSPEADPRTLLRRVSLDLIGLPPTPGEVAAFLADKKPGAYERQVERLLASPHYGERMAAPWLDLVRYADTVGYHGDQNQNIFPYRDYVIDAFNSNKPFDQFTIEQLAGDLLTNATAETRIASGFNRLNMMTREGGAQPKEYLAKYAADRVRTVSMAWLGSTMGCAECHDHKYDPFTSKDFYQMAAFFADLKQWGVYSDYPFTPLPDLPGYGNDHPFPPEIQVDNGYLRQRIARLNEGIDAAQTAAAARLKTSKTNHLAFEEWLRESRQFAKRWPTGWASPPPQVTLKMKDTNSPPATNFTVRAGGAITFTDNPKENTTVTLPVSHQWISAIRLEIEPQSVKELQKTPAKKRNGTAFSVSAVLRSGGKEQKLPFHFGEADHAEPRYSMSLPIIGVTDLWQISTKADYQTAIWLLDKPVHAKPGDELVINLGNAAVESARVSITPFAALDPFQAGLTAPVLKSLTSTPRSLTQDQKQTLFQSFLLATQRDPRAVTEMRNLQAGIRECRGGKMFTMVSLARPEPLPTRVLPRGNWQNETGELLQPAVPHFLPQPANPQGRRLTRLDLARWLVATNNPLTARATMNRLWKQFFGAGISAVVDDLGGQGELPLHPELLDWLACEFQQPSSIGGGRPLKPSGTVPTTQPHAWDMKHMVRLMVTSAAYRQSSNPRRDLKEIDPNNRLVAAQTPRRLEAEFVRDNALCIAGLLNEDIGGPSAHPYQPAGYYANLQFPDRDYHSDTDDRQYRRGLYTHWQRTFLHPMLANFDAPSREECTASRMVSDTPQQALTLLNDPSFVEAARVFAARLLEAKCRDDTARIDLVFERALARKPRANERASLLNFLNTQRAEAARDPAAASKLVHTGNAAVPKSDNATELAAWTEVCRVVLNLHETITRL